VGEVREGAGTEGQEEERRKWQGREGEAKEVGTGLLIG